MIADEDKQEKTDDGEGGPIDLRVSKDRPGDSPKTKEPKKGLDRIGVTAIKATATGGPETEEQAED